MGAWIGAELLVGFVTGILLFVSSAAWGWPEDPEKTSWVAYLPALGAAVLASHLVVKKLQGLPRAGEEEPMNLPPRPWEQGIGN